MIKDDKRLILYSNTFISRLDEIGAGDWSALSVLAHEIGHHLQGHTIQAGGSNHRIELEADQFSGFVVRRLGGSLSEAQAVMSTIASPGGSATHPPKSARLEAIATGWRLAGQQSRGTTTTTTTGPTPPPDTSGGVPATQTLKCRFNSGRFSGQVIDFSNVSGATPALVGSTCTDSEGGSGIAVPPDTPSRPYSPSGGRIEQRMSTVCEFRTGYRAGQRQDYAGYAAPLPVGSQCRDGQGNFGVVVPR